MTDLLGSTVALGTGTAGVQTRYAYDPYGVAQTPVGTASTNPFQFTGRENDGTTAGLMFYRARYYNPAWGRFVSEDPIGIAGGVNLYAYVGEQPTGWRDPTGNNPAVAVLACLEIPVCAAAMVGTGAWIATHIPLIWCSKAPNTGDPDSTYVNPGSGQKRKYGPDGKPILDIDSDHDHDHGQGQGVPHAHDWTPSSTPGGYPTREPGRPLNPGE